jgi:hypothetical protein
VPAKLATRVRVYSTGHGNKTDPNNPSPPNAGHIRAAIKPRAIHRRAASEERIAFWPQRTGRTAWGG